MVWRMKKYANPRGTLIFICIAAVLMVLADMFFFPKVLIQEEAGPHWVIENSEIQDYESVKKIQRAEVPKEFAASDVNVPQPEPVKNNTETMAKIGHPAKLKVRKDILPPPAIRHIEGTGKVVIIIDDMGMDRKHSQQIIDLPVPLTLAFLPYAPKLSDLTEKAKANGHELIIHVPMQPIDASLDPGPLVLRDDMSDASFDQMLEKIFASFDGYKGINNHMGSKLTQDREAMDKVMEALAQRNLMFIDSKTIPNSVAAESAATHGLAFAERDVFLDHQNVKQVIMNALHELEVTAKRRGYAIAIGHPRETTIQALKEWLPTLKERGLTLVPVSAVARKMNVDKIEPSAGEVNPSSVISVPESFGPVRGPAPRLLLSPEPY
jgi:polysaccharide deacetylase 2 family uncharacterized protein YibQ